MQALGMWGNSQEQECTSKHATHCTRYCCVQYSERFFDSYFVSFYCACSTYTRENLSYAGQWVSGLKHGFGVQETTEYVFAV